MSRITSYTQRAQYLLNTYSRFSASMAPRHKKNFKEQTYQLKEEIKDNNNMASEKEIQDALNILNRIPEFK